MHTDEGTTSIRLVNISCECSKNVDTTNKNSHSRCRVQAFVRTSLQMHARYIAATYHTARIALLSSRACRMTSRQCASTERKEVASTGSCRLMSGAVNMGSKFNHFLCSTVQLSSTAWTSTNHAHTMETECRRKKQRQEITTIVMGRNCPIPRRACRVTMC